MRMTGESVDHNSDLWPINEGLKSNLISLKFTIMNADEATASTCTPHLFDSKESRSEAHKASILVLAEDDTQLETPACNHGAQKETKIGLTSCTSAFAWIVIVTND